MGDLGMGQQGPLAPPFVMPGVAGPDGFAPLVERDKKETNWVLVIILVVVGVFVVGSLVLAGCGTCAMFSLCSDD